MTSPGMLTRIIDTMSAVALQTLGLVETHTTNTQQSASGPFGGQAYGVGSLYQSKLYFHPNRVHTLF